MNSEEQLELSVSAILHVMADKSTHVSRRCMCSDAIMTVC